MLHADDLTEEEKLEPVKNLINDPRIRLLNRLYAKKRKVRAQMLVLDVKYLLYHLPLESLTL